MRNLLTSLVLSCLLVACTPQEQPDFHLKLTLSNSEVSDDSNSTYETVDIEGYRGSYQWTYSGYAPDDSFDRDKKVSFMLTDEELQSLVTLMRENGLFVDRTDTVSTGKPWSEFDVSWDLRSEGESAVGHVTGVSTSWDEYRQNEEELLPDESWFAATSVIDFIQEIVQSHD